MHQGKFIPKNHDGVLYLFARFHERLGFEEITDISQGPPDITTKRRGATVHIELEHKSGQALIHYSALKFKQGGKTENPNEGKWTNEGKRWLFILKNGKKEYELTDPQNEFWLDEKRGRLLLKSQKMFSIIVCWEREDDDFIEPSMEVIELKKELDY
jgi:hypothetical protein